MVIHQAPPVSSSPVANAATEATTTTQINYQMQVRVEVPRPESVGSEQGRERSEQGRESTVISSVDEESVPSACPGVTVDETGETRSGRRLGMGLLQVYARPGAELLVDKSYEGETPLIAVGVDAGPRDVRLRNLELGYDCTFRLRVLPGMRYSLLLDVMPH